jgi:hypothetical protein
MTTTVVLRRRTMRDATLAALLNQTNAADRVYPTPILPWRRERPLPAIGVYTLGERATPLGGVGNMGPFQLRQSLDITIEALVEVLTDETLDADARLRLDTQTPLDELCAQISCALLPNVAWRNPIEGLERWETRVELARVDEADRRTAAATITATVNYTCIAEPIIADQFLRSWFDVDVIDPAADPNTTGHPTDPPGYPGGYPGPDGRVEVQFAVELPQDPAPTLYRGRNGG